MIRLFYVAAAVLLISACIEQALAQAVSLSPGIAEAASSPRYSSSLSANVNRASGPTVTQQQLQSERCASLKASIDWVQSRPTEPHDPGNSNYRNFVSNSWGGADNQRSPDRPNELERQATMLGCPKDTSK
ncbi:hypothetical protein [Caballeronia ptereochthonis]|uniref:Lipoprotein n=1 Tax=Caballeronia ptereochthonis TaxID=1777144 RepID=A0A158AW95_9BURK|nr:hypothetical protein [Caballeronia ptereochthonis]SAK61297.1 hypothetical protein AWB83_02351 [Caballeronia ptereochthonis]